MNLNENFIITYPKEGTKFIGFESRKSCKILKFLSEFTFDEFLIGITELNSKEFQNLFFFIFESQKFKFCGQSSNQKPEKVESLETFLLRFCKIRPIILQLVSKTENVTKFYYKDENVGEFFEINQQAHELRNIHQFPTFFSALMNKKVDKIDDELIEKLTKIGNSSLIVRLLRTLDLSEDLNNKIIFKCAANGSKNQLLAALDVPFENGNDGLHLKAQNYLTNTFNHNSDNNENQQSLLLIAIENSNTKVLEFLTTSCKHLIKQLPYDHQVDISTAAFKANYFEVLCDLLQCDFPFPDDFESSDVNYARLRNVIDDREAFHRWIEEENIKSMEQFIESNQSMKIIYNTQNESALYNAMMLKKFKIFYYLKSLGFEGVCLNSYTEIASDDEELEVVKKSVEIQRRKNISNAVPNVENSVMIMVTKSLIHKQMISDKTELEYRQMIDKWFKGIYRTKIGSKLLDVASQCQDLKIFFDFENETVRILIKS